MAHHWSLRKKQQQHAAGGIWFARPLLLSPRSLRLKTPGYELWAFSLLMNWASNAGDRGDSLISVSRWQIFIEFWKETSLYFLPWITEILAPMAPVYEGKMFWGKCAAFCLWSCTGLSHSAYCINGDTIELRLTRRERCVAPSLISIRTTGSIFTLCFLDLP